MKWVKTIYIYNEDFFYKKVLGVDGVEEVQQIVQNKSHSYTPRSLNKSSTGVRILHCIKPNSKIYDFQKNLVKYLFSDVPLPDSVYGFVSGRSYKDFLMPHINDGNEDKFYIRLDIKDFFGSINEKIISEELSYLIKINNDDSKEKIMLTILDIITLNGSLPQGAVTSPIVSNIVFRRIDQRINKYCKKHNVYYTRYADDLLFSTLNNRIFNNQNIKYFIKMIVKILKDFNFEINRRKIKKSKDKISLNGFVIDTKLRISRKKKQDISKLLFLYEYQGVPSNIKQFLNRLKEETFYFRKKPFKSKYQIVNYLAGYRAFLIDWCKEDYKSNSKNRDKNRDIQLIKRIEELIINVDKLK